MPTAPVTTALAPTPDRGPEDCDVAIVGGGLVGASLAARLAGSDVRVVLIEAAAPPASAPSWDERCIALNEASQRILDRLGVWPQLAAEATAITATHISERGRFGTTRFDAAEAGLPALGWNVPLRAIGAALHRVLHAAPNVQVLQPARVSGWAEAGADRIRLTLARPGLPDTALHARLVAAADGAQSSLRTLIGIEAEHRDYRQQAIVTAVRVSRPQPGVAWERFTPDGPIALIPKPDDAMSLVWTVPDDAAAERLAEPDDRFLRAAESSFGGRLGHFTALGQRRAWPLSRVVSRALVAPRTVLIGNAAQSLHPVAAQGFNLGLRDVATLAETILAGADPGAAAGLAAYAEQRRTDRARVSDFTDLLVLAFSNRTPGLAQARHWGLVGASLLPPLRDSLLRQHLGQLGWPGERLERAS